MYGFPVIIAYRLIALHCWRFQFDPKLEFKLDEIQAACLLKKIIDGARPKSEVLLQYIFLAEGGPEFISLEV